MERSDVVDSERTAPMRDVFPSNAEHALVFEVLVPDEIAFTCNSDVLARSLKHKFSK